MNREMTIWTTIAWTVSAVGLTISIAFLQRAWEDRWYKEVGLGELFEKWLRNRTWIGLQVLRCLVLVAWGKVKYQDNLSDIEYVNLAFFLFALIWTIIVTLEKLAYYETYSMKSDWYAMVGRPNTMPLNAFKFLYLEHPTLFTSTSKSTLGGIAFKGYEFGFESRLDALKASRFVHNHQKKNTKLDTNESQSEFLQLVRVTIEQDINENEKKIKDALSEAKDLYAHLRPY